MESLLFPDTAQHVWPRQELSIVGWIGRGDLVWIFARPNCIEPQELASFFLARSSMSSRGIGDKLGWCIRPQRRASVCS